VDLGSALPHRVYSKRVEHCFLKEIPVEQMIKDMVEHRELKECWTGYQSTELLKT
jgi:hypothetical protein